MEKDSDANRGLYQKYAVHRRYDPTWKHDECEYLVLDYRHDKHARTAALAYADACEAEYPKLAKDIRQKLEDIPYEGR